MRGLKCGGVVERVDILLRYTPRGYADRDTVIICIPFANSLALTGNVIIGNMQLLAASLTAIIPVSACQPP